MKKKIKKKRENQGKHQGEMADDQRTNQTAKPLKEGKKIKNKNKKQITNNLKNHQFRNSGISVLVVLLSLL
jgi:hypothetical protein